MKAWTITWREVPYARDSERFPTVAWQLTRAGRTVVYASDVARPTSGLCELAPGAAALVVDGQPTDAGSSAICASARTLR